MFDLTAGTIDRPFRDTHASATVLSVATHVAVARRHRVGRAVFRQRQAPRSADDDRVRRRSSRSFATATTTAARGQSRKSCAGRRSPFRPQGRHLPCPLRSLSGSNRKAASTSATRAAWWAASKAESRAACWVEFSAAWSTKRRRHHRHPQKPETRRRRTTGAGAHSPGRARLSWRRRCGKSQRHRHSRSDGQRSRRRHRCQRAAIDSAARPGRDQGSQAVAVPAARAERPAGAVHSGRHGHVFTALNAGRHTGNELQ